MRGLSENVEYWSIKLDHSKGRAELEFLRPAGGRIILSIPIKQLSDLKSDVERQYADEAPAKDFVSENTSATPSKGD
jgi:hypothetical protein